MIKKVIIFIALLIVIASAGYFAYKYFFASSINNYLVENKYYGFKLQTPKNWVAEEKTTYTEDNIAKILADCKNDKSSSASVYEIGMSRFKDQRYPQDISNPASFPAALSSGVILEVTVNCIPDSVKDKIANYASSNLMIAGEKALETSLNMPGFGQTKSLSLLHNNLQYKINEYVYISPTDKANSESLKTSLTQVFDKIISSLKFN